MKKTYAILRLDQALQSRLDEGIKEFDRENVTER